MGNKSQPRTGACGHPVNSNDNCFVSSCWNRNGNRHADGGR